MLSSEYKFKRNEKHRKKFDFFYLILIEIRMSDKHKLDKNGNYQQMANQLVCFLVIKYKTELLYGPKMTVSYPNNYLLDSTRSRVYYVFVEAL